MKMSKKEASNQIKSIDKHRADLNLLYKKMEAEGLTAIFYSTCYPQLLFFQ